MNTKIKQKQLLKDKESQQRKSKRTQKQRGCNQAQRFATLQPQEDGGLYELIKQDEQLRAYHVAKLLSTRGYEHFSDEAASDMIAQMLQLSTLMFEMLVEGEANRQVNQNLRVEERADAPVIKRKRSR